ncbi:MULTISPECIES: TetR/AcrR family transcriptional regulator [unclassified Streptomyces]|uniref:TetR/AcrR family transcriptional regulator n=1 Tax=unclassified Streptomyces TaxID=2593676 RepID=UPI00278C689E|nr:MULTISPECIES: TetR/AcrR family transcriptional regulator [unclassified Streptomyces]
MKQDRARRTHEVLLDAAASAFVRHGFAGANLSEVAARSRLTKGALYGHFASKADLAEELVRGFEEEWAKLLATHGSSLRGLALGFDRRIHDDVRFAAGLRLAVDASRVARRESAPLGELRTRLLELVRDAQREERMAAEHRPEVLARLILAVLLGVFSTRFGAEDVEGVEGVGDVGDVGDVSGGGVETADELWDAVLSALGPAV